MKSLALAIVPLCAGLLCAQAPQGQTQVKQTETTTTVTVGPTNQLPPEAAFDVRYHDDRGKLLVSSRGVSFEDVTDAKHSRTWTYAQIKELKRDGNEIKIDPHDGDSMEFKVDGGKGMSDEVYKVIADRIVAARAGGR
jgi:hypothetical protein